MSSWRSIKRCRGSFDDDIVLIYDLDTDKEIYRGTEDFSPYKDENWTWDQASQSYICVDCCVRKIVLDI